MTPFIPRLLDKLRHRFSPSRLRIGNEAALLLSAGGSKSRELLVGRERCLFLSVELARIPEKQRPAVVALAVRRAAPFSDPGFDVVWQGDRAAVWFWPASGVEATVGGVGAGDRLVAEAPRLGRPREDGAELLSLPDGVEARLWREGQLRVSRWWPAMPDAAEWQRLVRGAGLEAAHYPLPLAETPEYQTQPWQGAQPSGLRHWLGGTVALPPLGARFALPLIALAFAWQLGGGLRAWWSVLAVEAEEARVAQRLEPVLVARARADEDRAAVDALLGLRPPVPQIRLLAEAARLMEGTGWRPIHWSQPNEQTLELRFEADRLDGEAVVQRWEASPWFTDVTPALAPRGGGMTLRARITLPTLIDRGGEAAAQ